MSSGEFKKGSKGSKKAAAKQDTSKHETEYLNQFYTLSKQAAEHKIEWTEEEAKENFDIGLEYNRQTTIRHNKNEKDLTNKIWIQCDALDAMPDHLREHAEIIDESPPPADRPWPIWATPPIKGFNASDYANANDQEGAVLSEEDKELFKSHRDTV